MTRNEGALNVVNDTYVTSHTAWPWVVLVPDNGTLERSLFAMHPGAPVVDLRFSALMKQIYIDAFLS